MMLKYCYSSRNALFYKGCHLSILPPVLAEMCHAIRTQREQTSQIRHYHLDISNDSKLKNQLINIDHFR